MITTDATGVELARGDWVRMSVSSVVLDPSVGDLGPGQIIHIFSDRIHVKFKDGIRTGNSGLCFEKVGPPDL